MYNDLFTDYENIIPQENSLGTKQFYRDLQDQVEKRKLIDIQILDENKKKIDEINSGFETYIQTQKLLNEEALDRVNIEKSEELLQEVKNVNDVYKKKFDDASLDLNLKIFELENSYQVNIKKISEFLDNDDEYKKKSLKSFEDQVENIKILAENLRILLENNKLIHEKSRDDMLIVFNLKLEEIKKLADTLEEFKNEIENLPSSIFKDSYVTIFNEKVKFVSDEIQKLKDNQIDYFNKKNEEFKKIEQEGIIKLDEALDTFKTQSELFEIEFASKTNDMKNKFGTDFSIFKDQFDKDYDDSRIKFENAIVLFDGSRTSLEDSVKKDMKQVNDQLTKIEDTATKLKTMYDILDIGKDENKLILN